MRKALIASTAFVLAAGTAHAQSCTQATSAAASQASSSGFHVSGGQIIGPDGKVFRAAGVNIGTAQMASFEQYGPSLFPGINFVRLATGYTDPTTAAQYAAFGAWAASKGIVVEIEDHVWTANGSPVLTGSALTNEANWYASIAAATAPYRNVWFGTENEAYGSGTDIAAEQSSVYNAVRGAGNNSMIMLEAGAGAGIPGMVGSSFLPTAPYAAMSNVAWDLHFYGWVTDSTDQATVSSVLQGSASSASGIAAAQTITSADGTVPVILGEFGPSTNGSSNNANSQQVINAVLNSGLGFAAWAWQPDAPNSLTDGNGNITAYGRTIAAGIAAAASQAGACPSPTAAATASNALSIDQVAALAASGSANQVAPADPTSASSDRSVASTAALAASGADPGGTLAANDAATQSAAGPVATVAPIVRTVNSPTGTMPTPAPVANSTSFTASDNYQTVVPTPGNGTGTVSGIGNTINAGGGIQTISVTGPGNNITTGPYDDTITVSAPGNTINAGGGSDTIVLAYGGQAPTSTVNADAAAVAPLGSVGNIFVAPAPGTGVLTIQGTLAVNDHIDLTKALAGTAGWTGDPATIWNFVNAYATGTGCELSIGSTVIVKLPNGSPSGNIGSFLTASAS